MICLTITALAAVGAELVLAYRTPVAAHAEWEAQTSGTVVTRFYAEAWNGGRLTCLTISFADDHLYHDPFAPAAPVGPGGVADIIADLRGAFPDLALTLDDVAAQADRVVVRFTAHGTHRGTFLGAEGTGRTVQLTGVAIHRVVGRRIAETWVNWDIFGVARQIGLVLLPVSALGDWEGAPSGEGCGRPH